MLWFTFYLLRNDSFTHFSPSLPPSLHLPALPQDHRPVCAAFELNVDRNDEVQIKSALPIYARPCLHTL